MKKSVITLILLTFCCLFNEMNAGNNPLSDKGYAGNVGLSITPQMGFGAEISTSHGYSFGNGLWMGGGIGIIAASNLDGAMLPVFAEAKYTFFKDEKASPFIDCSLGYITDLDDVYTLFSPAAGVDINGFSVFVKYWSTFKSVSIGFRYNF